MTTPDQIRFIAAISAATSASEAFRTLEALAQAVAGHRLFTVMTVDMKAGLARRAYSNDPVHYPVSGTKPITRNSWFDIVHGERRSFIANTIEDIATVFPDHELIAALGCGSVINLPVVLGGDLVATINMLDAAHHYTDVIVERAEAELSVPARLCCALALLFDSGGRTSD
jgi:hypothetical protein